MRPLNWIQWLTLATVLALAVVVPLNFIQENHTLRQATRALCLQRENYLSQYRATKKYLAQHPEGAPALGLSAAYLEQAAAKNLAQVKALDSVRCARN